MSVHNLTKAIHHETFVAELLTEGVTSRVAIGSSRVTLSGPLWEGPSTPEVDALRAAELAMVATVETAHAPDTVTEATISAHPHGPALNAELLALPGVTRVSAHRPVNVPGVAVIHHNPLTTAQQAALKTAVEDHDASAIPALSVVAEDQVIAADDLATGTVTVSDSRGAAAEGKTVRIRIPLGGGGGIDGDSYVLDASGDAVVTFGATGAFTGEMTFEAYYENGEADSALFTVRRGTP